MTTTSVAAALMMSAEVVPAPSDGTGRNGNESQSHDGGGDFHTHPFTLRHPNGPRRFVPYAVPLVLPTGRCGRHQFLAAQMP